MSVSDTRDIFHPNHEKKMEATNAPISSSKAQETTVELFILLANAFILGRETLKKVLMSLSLNDFTELIRPYYRVYLHITPKEVEARQLLNTLIKEVIRERGICDKCFSGTMAGSMVGGGHHHSHTCSNPACGHKQDRE
ncbi:MAG: hypothetical protein Q8O98_00865 [bacterium]|nr:hypothetical protein [bacterium]